jgi:imidazole glycerol-phosphate synthase subunit HisH
MIAIIDYEAGNLASVARAVSHLGHANLITRNAREISAADRIIFPGVGAAGSAMNSLRRLGIDTALHEAFNQGKPILGICLGTQIIMGYSEENQTRCLGIIPGSVRAFPPDLCDSDGSRLKIPQMGWNSIHSRRKHPVLSGISDTDEFYFVHGYYPEPAQTDHILGTTGYGIQFASVVGYRNILATQFHLEKSGRPGLKLLNNFCQWNPEQLLNT